MILFLECLQLISLKAANYSVPFGQYEKEKKGRIYHMALMYSKVPGVPALQSQDLF